jgi:integrase
MTQKLTKSVVDRLVYDRRGNERCVVWDTLLPGFGVRVYPSGRKAFILSYRVHGRKRLLTLGMYGALTLEQARDLARIRLGEATGGDDPVEQRKKERQGETVRHLCAAYLERHAARKRSHRDDRRRIEQRIIPPWGNRKANSITRADVAALHSRIGQDAPYEANRTIALLSKMFELARRWDFVPENAANPARGIDKFREHKRDRWVTHEELPRVTAAIAQEPNLYVRAALWLYLLTGVRKTELLKTRWEDVDLVRCALRLPETKAGRVHYVPLSPPAISLLENIPPEADNPYLLPSTKVPGHHLVNIEKPWRRVRKAAGVEDVRLHDLRRTVGSWLAQAGNSLPLIGRVLNHTNASTTQIYARLGDDPARKVLAEHGERLTAVAGEHFPVPARPSLPPLPASKAGEDAISLVKNAPKFVFSNQQPRALKTEHGGFIPIITSSDGNLTRRNLLYLLIIMIGVLDVDKHNELLVTDMARSIMDMEAKVLESGDPDREASFKKVSEERLASSGSSPAFLKAMGIDAFDERFDKRFDVNLWRGRLAGLVLQMLVHASLRKEQVKVDKAVAAVDKLVRDYAPQRGKHGKSFLYEVCAEFKPVVHLWAASITIDQTQNEAQLLPFLGPESPGPNVPYFLGVAEWFRQTAIGLTVGLGRMTKPVLDPLNTWRFSRDFRSPSDLKVLPAKIETDGKNWFSLFVARRQR